MVVAASAWPILMGSSRIYLGRHYLTDVLGSCLLGTVWLLLGIATLLALDRKN
jgi:membrane-associated phospholipid phosphatase